MKEYLLRVLCATFLCSIVHAIGGEGRGPRNMISGLFLALSLLQPLGSLDLSIPELVQILEQAEEAAAAGEAQALAAKNKIISDSLEAYILTKAAELEITVVPGVTVSDEGLPVRITLTGTVSPSERDTLTGILVSTLGVRKEDLQWEQTYQSFESTPSSSNINIQP